MKIEENSSTSFLTVIAGRKQKDALIQAMLDIGIHLINTTYAKGSVNAHFLMKSFGLVAEKNKVMITCVSTDAKINAFLKELDEDFGFRKPNTGIAFTIPIESVSCK